MGTKIKLVGSFFLWGRGSGLFSKQFLRKFKVFKEIYPRLPGLKAKYALQNTLKVNGLPV